MSRQGQINMVTDMLSGLRKNRKHHSVPETPENVAQDFSDKIITGRGGRYMHGPNSQKNDGIILDEEQTGIRDIVLMCIEDVNTVKTLGTFGHEQLLARLITRWIEVN